MADNQRRELTTQRASWYVLLLPPEHATKLAPIAFAVHTGASTTQDYLTADQARELAVNLVAAADAVEAQP